MKWDKTVNQQRRPFIPKDGEKKLIGPGREMQEWKKIPVGKNRSKLNCNFICPGFTFYTTTGRATKKRGFFLSWENRKSEVLINHDYNIWLIWFVSPLPFLQVANRLTSWQENFSKTRLISKRACLCYDTNWPSTRSVWNTLNSKINSWTKCHFPKASLRRDLFTPLSLHSRDREQYYGTSFPENQKTRF